MKHKAHIATAVLSAGLLFTSANLFAQYPPPPPPYGYAQGGWDAPPAEFTREVQRRGFSDGINGARKDAANHRVPNVYNRDEYRKYHGPEPGVYRSSFERGYNTFWQHQGGPGPRPY